MTTMTKKRSTKKPLRIREELLPESAVYGTFADREYIMIPVEDFGEWYEDIEDGAVVQYTQDNPTPLISAEQVKEKIARRGRSAKR